jgi:fucose permease
MKTGLTDVHSDAGSNGRLQSLSYSSEVHHCNHLAHKFCRCIHSGCARLPSSVQRGDGRLMRSVGFLLFRFKASAQWNMLMALVPILLVTMEVMLSISNFSQVRSFPWRVEMAKYVDSAMVMSLIAFLCCSGFMGNAKDTRSLAAVCSIFLILVLVLGLASLVHAFVCHMHRRNFRTVSILYCHHKADGAAQAG